MGSPQIPVIPVRRNTVSGAEPMRIDTAHAVPILFLSSANLYASRQI